MGKEINEIEKRINKQISHLTGTRAEKTREKMTWEVGKMACEMTCYLEEFIGKVDGGEMESEYRCEIEKQLREFKDKFCKGSSINVNKVQRNVISTTNVIITTSILESNGIRNDSYQESAKEPIAVKEIRRLIDGICKESSKEG